MAAEAKIEGSEISFVKDGYAGGKAIPWWAKMTIKVTLGALPVPYRVWKRLGVFQHGDVNAKLPNLLKSFRQHFDFYQERKGQGPSMVLELGPGDSAGHVMCAKALGCDGAILVDAGDFASTDPAHYEALHAYLKDEGLDVTAEAFDREDVLAACGGSYKTQGLASMPEIAAESVDLSYSHAVFEHIRRDEFAAYMKELYRVTKPGGVSRHWVDLHDHLGGALNSMRFAPGFWEGWLIRRAGFYTNRLTMQEMMAMAEDAGFKVEIPKVIKWKALVPDVKDMDESFQSKSEEELNVCTFLMVMEKP